MSFGFSIGDLFAVSQLAWRVYKSCKGAPESFGNISDEVLSFHAVLKEVEETIAECQLSTSQTARLGTITHGCEKVLQDLQVLVDRYEFFGSQRTWDRVKWGAEDVAELRARLRSNNGMLVAFIRWDSMRRMPKLGADFHLVRVNSALKKDSARSAKTAGSISLRLCPSPQRQIDYRSTQCLLCFST